MKQLIVTAFLAAGLVAPVHASEQLALRYDVDPGSASVAELAALKALDDSENDFASVAYKKDQINGTVTSTQSIGVSQGHAQLAASLGLDPEEYSVAELALIRHETDETIRAGLIETYGGNGVVTSTQSPQFNDGHTQLARSLGVDPEDYTTAELVEMRMPHD